MPISFGYERIRACRKWILGNVVRRNQRHDRLVGRIQQLVQQAHREGRKMCTARAPWKTMSIRTATYKDDLVQIPIPLGNILSLDRERNIVRVEPMVTMSEITRYLVPKGYALAVQVEMDDLTVGGLCMGIGIETSSHREGFLFETVAAYEVVSATGELLRATRHEHEDLFHSLPMSHGTLGFLVAVELRIVPVSKYIKLRYIPCHSHEAFCEKMEALSTADCPPSYLEGLVFDGNGGVIMTGELAARPDETGTVNAINRWYKPWFHEHARSFLTQGEAVEFVPLRQYFHRHTRSVFFQLKDLIPFAHQRWYRWLFGWLGAPKISLMKRSMTPQLRRRAFENRVSQDIIIPMNHLHDALTLSHRHYAIYPLWVCPVKLEDHGKLEGLIRNPKATNGSSQMYVDLGIYGIPPAVKEGTWRSVEVGRMLERFTRDRHGFHMLYADIFMSFEEFQMMFEHSLYRQVRARYGAQEAFPEVYKKVIPEKWLFVAEEVSDAQEKQESPTDKRLENVELP